MKHIKTYENSATMEKIKSSIKNWHETVNLLYPIVISKYKELAEDENYQPEAGETPESSVSDELTLTEISSMPNGLYFTLDWYGEFSHSVYYIDMTNEEIEEGLMKIDAKKYNL
jgi:hypothetical protein